MGYGRKTEKEAACTTFGEFRALYEQREQERRDAWEIARWEEWHQTVMNPYVKQGNKPRTPKSMMRFPWETEDLTREITPEDCHIDKDTLAWLEKKYNEYYNNGKDR